MDTDDEEAPPLLVDAGVVQDVDDLPLVKVPITIVTGTVLMTAARRLEADIL